MINNISYIKFHAVPAEAYGSPDAESALKAAQHILALVKKQIENQ
jgi:hypothetical protein